MVLYRFIIDESRCMNCGACMDLCPSTCIEFTRPDDVAFYGERIFPSLGSDELARKSWMMEKPFVPMQERCTGCQICVRECPTNAVTVVPDQTSASVRPKPVILRREVPEEDGGWHALSEYTRDYLKRPVRSPWSAIADWKPMTKERMVHQTWRTMEQE
jgi:ferredoxin